jgi:hypothetical protein
VHDVKVGGPRAAAQLRPARSWLSKDSWFWLILASVLFLAAQLTPSLLRMPLGADEITYIARTSVRVSGVMLPPVHGQGAGLLAAPVTLFTTSLLALRIWMAVLSTIGLFLGMLSWRGLRPPWVLALAALIFGSLAISQNSGVQVYPDWWGALGVLALTGLFLHAVHGTMRSRVVLPLIAVASLLIVLMRPQNIVFLMGPAIAAAVLVPGWRKPRVLIAMAVGIGLGCLQWVIGAFIWYGGLGSRIHLAGQEPPSFGFYFSLGTQVKVLSGPWYCVPPRCTSWNMPGESVWWFALLAVAILGLCVAWRTAAKVSSLFAAVTALWVITLYSFLVPFGAPRYILPALALIAILAADGIVWLVTEAKWRTAGVILACGFLLAGVISQRIVLNHEIRGQVAERQFQTAAAQLRAQGVRPPCAIRSPSVAYYADCTAPWTGETMHELLNRTPGGFQAWHKVHLPRSPALVYERS